MAGVQKAKLPAVVWIAIVGVTAVCMGLFVGVYAWRIGTFDRTIATVLSVRTEQRPSRGKPRYVTVGELAFTRVDHLGRSFDCQHEFDIGTPADHYAPGDQIEIIPATGSCQRADIIGRPDRP